MVGGGHEDGGDRMSEMWGYLIDRSLYDHPGAEVTMKQAIRKWKDRPALAEGERVTIVRFKHIDGSYGLVPRLLVRNADGAERWVHATDVTDLPESHEIIDTRKAGA